MQKISATRIHPVSGPALTDTVLVLDDTGKVLALQPAGEHDPTSVQKLEGELVPGFINTHCHLELSHMKGVAPTGTGLLPFLRTVVNYRDVAEQEIMDAIDRADADMYRAGIVAVGDISNKLDTAARKDKSPIRYYTFVEMFDFLQEDLADQVYGQYKEVYDGQASGNGNRKSAVPHAPYTVSKNLFRKINQLNAKVQTPQTISIHNQETAHENELFLSKSGDFLDFFTGFGFSIDDWPHPGKTAIHYALERMDPQHRTLFVHNTMTTQADIRAAQDWNDQVFWATCPNANLYIENRLPNYKLFLETDAVMTVGTDSLTSNWQLSVLEEMKTISQYQSYIPFETLLQWATLNGARALGFDDELGSFEPGKRPGVNLITGLDAKGQLGGEAEVRRVI